MEQYNIDKPACLSWQVIEIVKKK